MPFPYLGRKRQLAHLYPRPLHDTIVEPFAGSAAYSLHADHWERNVVLVEKSPRIAAIWRWLTNASAEDVLKALPRRPLGERLVRDGSPQADLELLSVYSARLYNSYTVLPRTQDQVENMRRDIPPSLEKIRHCTIIEGDFREAPSAEATWFVDPPYQGVLGYGQLDSLDYPALSDWCKARQGQVIVCEHLEAGWLPFTPLQAQRNQKGDIRTEAVWLNQPDPGRLW